MRLLLAVAITGFASPTLAQFDDCEQLRQQLASASRGDVGRSAQYARAAQRQRAELARTQAYADQIGCGGGFSIFSDEPPPQCGAIEAQITRMTGNLSNLERQAAALQDGDPAQQAALAARYRNACAISPSPDGMIDGPGVSDDSLQNGSDSQDFEQPGESRSRGGKAVCVRSCDGGYFPLDFAGGQRDATGLQSLCTALCPNTEAKLYTVADMDNIGAAVSTDGRPYTELPAAFKFQKSFDAACTCKPANKSWVDALADAEKLLDKGANDVTVTSKMSDEMFRPGSPMPSKRKGKDRKAMPDRQAATDGVAGVSVPTGANTVGIAAGLEDRPLRPSADATSSTLGASGPKRRVRTIAPLP